MEIDIVDKDYSLPVAHIQGSRLPNLQQICMDRPHCPALAIDAQVTLYRAKYLSVCRVERSTNGAW